MDKLYPKKRCELSKRVDLVDAKKYSCAELDLYQIDIRETLIALNRLSNQDIACCIRSKLSPEDKQTFDVCMNNEMNAKNAEMLRSLISRNKKLMMGNSKTISEAGRDFLDVLKSFSEIAKTKFDFERKLKIRLPPREKTPPKKIDSSIELYNRKFKKAKIEFLINKKAEEEEKTKVFERLTRQCDHEIMVEVKEELDIIQEENDILAREKVELLEEIEKEKELYEKILKTVEKDEDELRKIKEKTENALFIILDRYDAEIGEKIDVHEDLVREKHKETKRLDKIKKELARLNHEYEEALKAEDIWEVEDLEKQVTKLKMMMAHTFINTFLSAYVKVWKREQPPPAPPKAPKGKGKKGKAAK